MVFKCMTCGCDIDVYYAHGIKLFCSKRCNDKALRDKLTTLEERQEERARRLKAFKEGAKTGKTESIVVKCMMCGAEMVQTTATPKLFCSKYCDWEQNHKHKFTREELRAERERRKQAYFAVLSSERKRALEYYKMKRGEFRTREEARLNIGGAPQPTRHCHNYPRCKNLTWDYYCPECRRKKRNGYVEEDYDETESVWDDFSVPTTEGM